MKKLFTVVMILSLFTSLFSSHSAKAQAAAEAAKTEAAAPATGTSTTTTTTTTEPAKTDAAAPTAPAADANAAPAATDAAKPAENTLENTLYLDLKDGRVVIQLLPEAAPNHVKRVKELVRQGFYNGVPFHRVIEGFMAQTGDPTGTGTGGSGQKINAEFNSEKHLRGTVSMARAADPNSADSQFFIVLADAPHLDGNYTAFGKVIEGMEFVDKVKKGNGPNGMVSDPDKIVKLSVAADEKGGAAPAAAASTTTTTTTTETKPADATTTAPATPAATETKPAEPAKQ